MSPSTLLRYCRYLRLARHPFMHRRFPSFLFSPLSALSLSWSVIYAMAQHVGNDNGYEYGGNGWIDASSR